MYDEWNVTQQAQICGSDLKLMISILNKIYAFSMHFLFISTISSNFVTEIFLFNLANITELVIIQLKFSNHIADLALLQCIIWFNEKLLKLSGSFSNNKTNQKYRGQDMFITMIRFVKRPLPFSNKSLYAFIDGVRFGHMK